MGLAIRVRRSISWRTLLEGIPRGNSLRALLRAWLRLSRRRGDSSPRVSGPLELCLKRVDELILLVDDYLEGVHVLLQVYHGLYPVKSLRVDDCV